MHLYFAIYAAQQHHTRQIQIKKNITKYIHKTRLKTQIKPLSRLF